MKQKFLWMLAAGCFLLLLLMQKLFYVQSAKMLFLGILLLIISIIDYRYFIIPDELLLTGFAGCMFCSAVEGEGLLQAFSLALLHGTLASAPLLLFVLLADRITGMETMGYGDIKLFFLLGVYFGAAKAWLAIFLSCVVGLVWYGVKQKDKQGELFPFGPSISIAAGMTALWGESFLEWYTQILF